MVIWIFYTLQRPKLMYVCLSDCNVVKPFWNTYNSKPAKTMVMNFIYNFKMDDEISLGLHNVQLNYNGLVMVWLR